MKGITIIGTVTGGVLSTLGLVIANLKLFEGRSVRVVLTENKRGRSTSQNAYYYGVVVPLVVNMFREAGELASPEYVHRYLKGQVGGMKKPVSNPDGTKGWDVDTSTKLTTAEWEDWMTAIRAWAAQFGLSIPMPNE